MAESDANADLPEGWEAVGPDEEGDYYWWNRATDETTWDKPAAPPRKATVTPPPKPPKPPKPARPPVAQQQQQQQQAAAPKQSVAQGKVAETMKAMQTFKDQKAAQERQARLHNAASSAQKSASVSRGDSSVVGKNESFNSKAGYAAEAASPEPRKYVFTKIEELPLAVDELRLNSCVVSGGSSGGGGVGSGGATTSISRAALLRKGGKDAAVADGARFPSGSYGISNENDCISRRKALQILCLGSYDFVGTEDGKGDSAEMGASKVPMRLYLEGPMAKHNRGGLCTYQFILTSRHLVYLEPCTGKDRYEVHHALPLATLRFSSSVDARIMEQPPANYFTIFSPAKSFVVAPPDESKVSLFCR